VTKKKEGKRRRHLNRIRVQNPTVHTVAKPHFEGARLSKGEGDLDGGPEGI